MPPLAAAPTDDVAHRELGDRSHELLDYRCENELGKRQVTLFGNGTIRLWEGLVEDPQMTLGELTPDKLESYVRRLRAEDLSEVDAAHYGVEGAWVERCSLALDLPGDQPRRYTFGRYDALPLALSALVRVADELAERTLPGSQLPLGYEPRAGDVLRRADGVLFEIVGFTGDGMGVELAGTEQPLTLYLRPDDLRSQFESLVSRRDP